VLRPWPNEYLPIDYFTVLAEIDGKYASMDIPPWQSCFPCMITRPGGDGRMRRKFGRSFFAGRPVAYRLPMDFQESGLGHQTGDHVDVLQPWS
jgi:hypothetical protein